jgi:hypothetical protein
MTTIIPTIRTDQHKYMTANPTPGMEVNHRD